MSRWSKTINQIIKLDRSLRYDELSKVLMKMGYSLKQPRGGGSHVTFRKDGRYPITMPMGDPINIAYIELVRDAVEQYESECEGNE